MNLNYNSISAQLYRWFYAKYEMPKTLCPYFWKLVIMWLLIIPYTVLALPYVIFHGTKSEGDSFFEKPIIGIFLYLSLFLVLAALFSISVFWIIFPKESYLFDIQFIGLFIWMVAITLGGFQFFSWLKNKYTKSKIKYDEYWYRIWDSPKEKESNIFVEWVKSVYHNYCPKIEWNNKNEDI